MFLITQRQYEMIMKQAQACYPQESGGILGGKNNVILGVLPIINQYLYNKTDTFGMTNEDMDRGYRFLEKNGLEYYGIYHTHPKGIPYPSKEDLSHGQKYLFIIGLSDRYNPELHAWQVEKNTVSPVPIGIVDEKFVEKMHFSVNQHKLSDIGKKDEMEHLSQMIEDMINGKLVYPKNKPIKWEASSFSTTA